jgi:hypothetical protein
MSVVNTGEGGYQIKLVDSVAEQQKFIDGPTKKKRRALVSKKSLVNKNSFVNQMI